MFPISIFNLGNSTLIEGESLEVENIQISVIESGDFGDVIKVSQI
jgi:hypothetical protein